VPDGLRIEIHPAESPLANSVANAPQDGSLGSGDAVRLAPPVSLHLAAVDSATSNEVALPDGALQQTYLVSLPVLAQAASSDGTFTWLLAVQQDGQFFGYMRYPSTPDPTTNSLVYKLPARVLLNSAVLPVMLKASQVQKVLPEVHGWSTPFSDAGDVGIVGAQSSTFDVLAPQVGGRIGVRDPDSGDMIWIDASGVGPTDSAVAPP
jgi:hypothetical protein